jgi:NADH dehydrogenase FAD-containing subunit
MSQIPIFAAGDTIAFADRNVMIPKNAQTAMMMVDTITANVMNALEKKPLIAFHYTSKGNILTLGPNDGVLQLKSLSVRSGLAHTIRNALYNIRERQITSN